MASTRISLAPCMACTPGVALSDQTSSATRPCCDDSCLDRVARRECALQCGEDDSSSSSSDQVEGDRASTAPLTPPFLPPSPSASAPSQQQQQVRSRKRKSRACDKHQLSVRERYSATLQALGCICKSLVERNLQACCGESQPGTARAATPTVVVCGTRAGLSEVRLVEGSQEICGEDRCDKMFRGLGEACSDGTGVKEDRGLEKQSCCEGVCGVEEGELEEEKSSLGCGVDGSCCAVAVEMPLLLTKPTAMGKLEDVGCCGSSKDACSGGGRSDGLGSEKSQDVARLGMSPCKSLCKEGNGFDASQCSKTVPVPDVCVGAACCSSDKALCSQEGLSPSIKMSEGEIETVDIEKSGATLEHVALRVQGLTCVGCETKLFRSLRVLPGVLNLQTSLVLSQAEFDLDEKAESVTQIIRSVEKSTGFTCQKLITEGQVIDVVVGDDAKGFAQRKYPDGVTQIVAVDDHIVRIMYDARNIGVRSLLNTAFDRALKLAPPRGSSELENGKKEVQKTAFITVTSALLTIPVLVLAWAPLPPRPITYGGVSLALATVVQLAIAGPFYPSALRALMFTRVLEMDLLIVLSTTTAYVFSVVSFAYLIIGQPLSTGEFFETSTLLVTLIMLGRLVSAFARQKAVESVSVRTLQAATAIIVDTDGCNEEEIDTRLLQHGDLFKVLPDSRIATDGTVISGATEVDESMVTGESLPVEKIRGSSVIAGSSNGSGVIVVRLTHLPGNNTISVIAAMVDEAKFSKPKTQELVDFIASYFVPVILALTVATFVIWIAIGVSVRSQTSGTAVINSLTYAISVLIVSCPCAIGLAVPMVIVISGGVAAKHGVVFKSALAIETARKVSHVVFDKTGTLTKGELCVVEEVYFSQTRASAESITLGLTRNSKHPVATAVANHLKGKQINAATVEKVQAITGKGVEGSLDGDKVRCGNSRWLSSESHPQVRSLLSKGLTVSGVTQDGQLIAVYGLSDSLRPDSKSVITELQRRSIAVSIVSGDDTSAVDAIATRLNVPASHVRSRCSPEDKQKYLKELMADENETVVFCGDGTNDAVALAQAHIGVHMNSASDIARTAANVVLVRPNLEGILVLLDLSKAAFHRICFNFAWSFVYNLFAILLAAGAFVHTRIPPQYAGLGEIVSVLPVILIALQLRWFKRD